MSKENNQIKSNIEQENDIIIERRVDKKIKIKTVLFRMKMSKKSNIILNLKILCR